MWVPAPMPTRLSRPIDISACTSPGRHKTIARRVQPQTCWRPLRPQFAGDSNRRRSQPQEIPTGGDSNRRRFQPHRELSPPPVPQEIGRLEGQCLLLDAENANMIEDLQRLTDERLQVLAHAKNMD